MPITLIDFNCWAAFSSVQFLRARLHIFFKSKKKEKRDHLISQLVCLFVLPRMSLNRILRGLS